MGTCSSLASLQIAREMSETGSPVLALAIAAHQLDVVDDQQAEFASILACQAARARARRLPGVRPPVSSI